MNVVLEDVQNFFYMLFYKYNIQMFEKSSNRNEIVYMGEFYSCKGERYIICVIVKNNRIVVQAYNFTGNNRVCVFQKQYSTVNDKKALSKSTSLFNFLDKHLSYSVFE